MTKIEQTPPDAYDPQVVAISTQDHPLRALAAALLSATNETYQSANALQASVRARDPDAGPAYAGRFDRTTIEPADLLAIARAFATIASIAARGVDSALEGLAVAGHQDELEALHDTTVGLIGALDRLYETVPHRLQPANATNRLGG